MSETQRAWCNTCQQRVTVLDVSIECDDGSGNPGFAQREYLVTTLACGHEVVAATGKRYPRVDGLAIN